MKITSVKDELELCGDNVVIRKRGVGNALASGLNGDRSIAARNITAIQLKKGGWTPGYILFSYAGSKPFNGGLIEATQDPDAFIFEKRLNEDVEAFKAKVEELMRLPKLAPIDTRLPSLTEELIKLAEMKNDGLLSQSEFEAAKAKLLG